jgi:hypothetical protein
MGAHVAGTSMRSGTPAAVKAQSEAIVEAVLGGVNVLQTAGHVHDGAADEVPPSTFPINHLWQASMGSADANAT